MMREMQAVRHLELADPLTAEVVESRLIARMLPRYNRVGTRADKYCYVRLDVDSAWPRLAIVKDPARTGLHLGPLPSRTMATLVVEALQSALPLRRCATRLAASYVAPPDASPCSAAQLGVAQCPCAGIGDATSYAAAVATAVQAMSGDPAAVEVRLRDRMSDLAGTQRYEEAALVRDRLSALLGAVKRDRLVRALRAAGRVEVRGTGATWIVDAGRLVDVTVDGAVGRALPVDPPPAPADGAPIARVHADEALCLARYFEQHAPTLDIVDCSGVWMFPALGDQPAASTATSSSTAAAPSATTPSWSIRNSLT
jgi:DNA polymerase-3 subunit epsilon